MSLEGFSLDGILQVFNGRLPSAKEASILHHTTLSDLDSTTVKQAGMQHSSSKEYPPYKVWALSCMPTIPMVLSSKPRAHRLPKVHCWKYISASPANASLAPPKRRICFRQRAQ